MKEPHIREYNNIITELLLLSFRIKELRDTTISTEIQVRILLTRTIDKITDGVHTWEGMLEGMYANGLMTT